MAEAPRDNNSVPTLLAVSSSDGTTPVVLWADPTTHRLLVDLPAGTGDVTGDSASADKEFVRFNGTGGKTIESPVTDNASVTATLSDNVDVTFYDATNDGNPVFSYGAAAAERLTITPTYDSGAQTLDYVEFKTFCASATADKGEFRFAVDETLVLTIDDDGIEIKASGALNFGAVRVLSDSAGTTTLENIDAIDATTEATIESAIDTLSNLTTTGALDAGSITSGFGAIDNGASNITTTGDITGGGIHVTGDTAAGDNAALGYTATEGLIITGQGSTYDISLKNDADALVLGVETGTTIVRVASELKFAERADHESTPGAGFGYLWVKSDTPSSLIFTDDAGTDTDLTATASGDVSGDSASADKEFVRFNGTGGKTIESPVTDNSNVTATLSDNVDVTFYDATNDGNPIFAYGASATERLTITPNYASGTQTLEFVELATATASATADYGEFRFNVDGTLVATIDDDGLEIKASGALNFGAVRILSDSSGTTTLENIDAIDATTEATLESAIDSLTNLVATGALDAGSITSNFGAIDNGASNITTTGDISGGTVNATGDTAAGDNAAMGYTATEGLILTGQGSTNDITIKNDADATVLSIPTGTTDVVLGVDGTASNLILAEKASIQMDPAGGADGDYSGVTFTGTGGVTAAFGDVLYLDSADSEWKLADADAASTSGSVAVAMAVSSTTDGNPVTLMTYGIVRADAAFPTLTVGAPVYISTTGTTTNTVTVTAPSGADDVIRVVGFGLTANEMLVQISPDHITHTG